MDAEVVMIGGASIEDDERLQFASLTPRAEQKIQCLPVVGVMSFFAAALAT